MKKTKLTENQMRSAVRKWLFEYNTDSGVSHRRSTDDLVAGTLGDDRQEGPEEPSPIVATDQMSNRLTRDLPPVDDEAYIPQNPEELAAASDQLGRTVPPGEVEWYYDQLKGIREKAIDRNNKLVANELEYEEPEIKNPITPKRGTVKEEGISAQTLIEISSSKNKKEFERAIRKLLREASFRKKDFARKWKQGDPLRLYRGDEESDSTDRGMDDFELDEEGDFVPSAEDLRDFIEAYPEADIEDAPGYEAAVERHQSSPNRDTSLEDLVRSGIYPDVKAPSGMKGRIDRTILPVVGAIKNAPQLIDRLTSLSRSSFGRAIFYQGMQAAGLITAEEVEDLKKNKEDLMDSEMYKYVMSQALVQPAMGILRKMEKRGEYDSKNSKSQISPEQAEEIIEKLKARWNGMSKSRKANDARRAMQGNLDFLSRDTSVAG